MRRGIYTEAAALPLPCSCSARRVTLQRAGHGPAAAFYPPSPPLRFTDLLPCSHLQSPCCPYKASLRLSIVAPAQGPPATPRALALVPRPGAMQLLITSRVIDAPAGPSSPSGSLLEVGLFILQTSFTPATCLLHPTAFGVFSGRNTEDSEVSEQGRSPTALGVCKQRRESDSREARRRMSDTAPLLNACRPLVRESDAACEQSGAHRSRAGDAPGCLYLHNRAAFCTQ